MTRVRMGLAAALLLASVPGWAAGPPAEVGYVEGFDHAAAGYALRRGGATVPVAVLTPVLNGDEVSVTDPTGQIRLRITGRDAPLALRQSDGPTAIAAPEPPHGVLSRALKLVSGAFDVFDHEQREDVAASIRGAGASDLSAPLLASPQTLAAGRQALVVGWVSPAAVDIRVSGPGGAPVAAGRGAGGLWASAPIALDPGLYRIEITAPGRTLAQALRVVAPAALPQPPAELGDAALPAELRETALATWLAAHDPALGLAGLQHAGPFARSFRPARVLARALVEGKRPVAE